MKYALTTILIMTILAAVPVPARQTRDHRYCLACGQEINGDSYQTGGSFYHSRCFTCNYCEKPIRGPYITYRNENYHENCFDRHVALKCAACGETIGGDYIKDAWGNSYHTRHEGNIVQCDFCRRFIAGPFMQGMLRYRDGRFLCGICAPSAVRSKKEVLAILKEAADILEQYGIQVSIGSIELTLVDRKELKKLSSRPSFDTTGFVDYSVKRNLWGRETGRKIKVYILKGMPRVQTIGAVAHELMHIWQFEHGSLDLPGEISEGSANYASYLVLKGLGTPEAAFMIANMSKNEDPVYGLGFRRIKKYVRDNGLAAWLDLLTSDRQSISSMAP